MKSLKTYISIIILLFINFIFSYKYSSRYTDYGLLISLILLLLQFSVFKYSDKINLTKKQKKIICYFLFIYITTLVIFSHFNIPVETLNVDRWSVISSFLTEFYNGKYPYFALSHMGNYPGPMPFYFLIAAPFFSMGELSLLSCIGYCILLVLFLKKNNINRNMKFLLFYVLTSLYLIWEITVRSNLFTFTVLIMLVLNGFMNIKNYNLKFYILALLTGFMLSTRSVYILPYIIVFLSSLINNEISFKRLLIFLSIAFVAFISTFMPFIYFYPDKFFKMNPFIIQSSFFLPTFYIFIFILIALLLAFLVKNRTDIYFYSGLSLFISILIYAIYNLVNYGYEVSYINNRIDISYFIFSIPFLMMYLLESNNINDNRIVGIKS